MLPVVFQNIINNLSTELKIDNVLEIVSKIELKSANLTIILYRKTRRYGIGMEYRQLVLYEKSRKRASKFVCLKYLCMCIS